jgi:cyclopropane-fatty-acyl-phospholipid synthase
MGADGGGVAAQVVGLLESLAGRELAVGVRAWDGSTAGAAGAHSSIVLRSPMALRQLLWQPDEVGLGRAFVLGDLDVDGDLYEVLAALEELIHPSDGIDATSLRGRLHALAVAARLGAVGPRPARPPEEMPLPRGRRSRDRDARVISHHYDVGNDFYRLVLGPSMVYSCAYFAEPGLDLEAAQAAKLDLVCRKLGLRPGMRFLDVGCGWGSLLEHAARHYGVEGVGLTLSREQAAFAEARLAAAGLAGRVQVRVESYEEHVGTYDAVASVGMAEHVGEDRFGDYAERLFGLLRPTGRLLNHAITRKPGPDPDPRHSFVSRYVFPDGDLQTLALMVGAFEDARLEVRDVESLREHYARTLRAWVSNLEARRGAAEGLVGVRRTRVWHLYMSAAALSFERGHTGISQVLAVRLGPGGRSGMPATRRGIAEPRRPCPPTSRPSPREACRRMR